MLRTSGRLYMWGRNDGRLIEEWRKPRDTVRDPQCLNPEPLAPVRHVSCGSCHAVALGGLPDFVHASESDTEEEEDDGDDDDEVTTSDSEDESDDTLSCFSGDGEQEEFVSGTNTQCSDGLSFRDPEPSSPAHKGACSSGKMTKLTIGEFYCLTPDLDTPPPSTLETDSPYVAPPPPSLSSSVNPPPPPSPHTPTLPSIPNNPSSSLNPETFQPCQRNDLRPLKGQAIATIQNVDLSTLRLPTAAAAVFRRPPNSGYSTRSKPRSAAALSVLSSAGRERRRLPLQRDAQELPPEKLGNDACEDTDDEDDLKETEEVQQQTSVNLVSGTNAVTPSKRRVQVGRSPFKTLPVITGSGREKCALVSKNVDILDIHQLLVGGGGGGGGGGGRVSGCSPQNSYVAQSPLLAHLGGLDIPGGFGGFKYLLDDDALLNNWGGQVPSPECCEGDDILPSSVPTHQIEGDFSGDKTKNKTKNSSSTSSSSPSAKLFGGLPGHLSRRPVKFFKRPAPIGHLSKTTTTTATTTQLSSQLPPLSASALAQFFQPSSLCYNSGDSRKSEALSRSGNVRSLGAVGMPSTAGDQELLGNFPGSSSRQQFIIQTPSSPVEAPDFQTLSTTISLLGTLEAEGSSWQDRLPLPGLAAAQDEKKTQSAPSRRKKRVSFADECTNNRSSSVLGNHHPRLAKPTPTTTTLAAAFAAVSRRPDTTPNFLTGNSRQGSHPDEGKHRASKNLDRQDSSQYRFVPAAFENHNFFRGSRPGQSQRPVPTLAYQRPGSKRQGSKSGLSGPRSGTLRTLMSTGPGPPRRSALKADEGRSGSGMVLAGSQGRQTRRAHFE